MKAGVIVPLDFTAILCCKHIFQKLQDSKDISEIWVICDETKDSKYINTLQDWGVNVHIITTPRHVSIFRDLIYCFRLYKFFKKQSFGIVISACTKPNIYSPIAAKFAKIHNICISIWGRGTAFNDDKRLDRTFIRFFLIHLYKLSFGLSSKIWITNPNDFDFFTSRGILTDKHNSLLTKNYIDTQVFSRERIDETKIKKLKEKLSINEDDINIVLVGRMIWPKGIKEFVDASKIVAKENKAVKFWLLGAIEKTSPDAVPERYLEEASKLTNFKWLGYQEDILSIYAIADVAVLPSYYREGGYPRALTEPMSLGLPVIGADSIDCRAPIENGKNGFHVPVKDSKKLAEYIILLAENPELRYKFGNYSRAKVEAEYDEVKIINEVVPFFLN